MTIMILSVLYSLVYAIRIHKDLENNVCATAPGLTLCVYERCIQDALHSSGHWCRCRSNVHCQDLQCAKAHSGTRYNLGVL
jgi:hypothetical protein